MPSATVPSPYDQITLVRAPMYNIFDGLVGWALKLGMRGTCLVQTAAKGLTD
jgi:hypothetical protein